MRKTNKENIILTTTNINTITKTPIEIALKIDKNGMTSLKNLLTKLEENQIKIQKSLPKKKFSYWSTKMFPKYQLLADYFNISNRELYKELFKELKININFGERICRTWNEPIGEVELSAKRIDKAGFGVQPHIIKY